MGIIKTQILKQSFFIYIGIFIGIINSLFIFPYTLSASELGLIRFIQRTAFLIFPIACLGIYTIPVKFFPVFKNEQNHNGLLFFIITASICSFLLFYLFFFFFESRLENYFSKQSFLFQSFWKAIIPVSILIAFNQILFQYISNFKKIASSVAVEELSIKVFIPLLAILYFFKIISFFTTIYGLIGIYIFICLYNIFYIWLIKEWKFRPNLNFLNRSLRKEIRTYASYSTISKIGRFFAHQIDILMLSLLALDELKAVGIYAIALSIAYIIQSPARALYSISAPIISQAWQEKNMEKIATLYRNSATNLLIIGCFLLLVIFSSIDDLYQIIPNGEVYALGKYVVLILGCAKVIEVWTSVNQEIIEYSNLYRFNFYAVLTLAIINIGLNFYLIPLYQLNGAAFATFISVFIFNLAKLLFIQFKFKFHPFSPSHFWIILIALIIYIGFIFIPLIDFCMLNIIIRTILISVLYGFTIFHFNISDDFNTLIKTGINKGISLFIKN